MSVKTFYFKDAVPSGATLHRSLQDGGTAPTTATTVTGWIPNSNATGQSCLMVGGTEVARNAATWGTTLQPNATPSTTLGDCWRSENAYTGDFANTAWAFTFGVRSVTAAYAGRFKLAVRIWASVNASGAGARELTAGRVASAATTANLTTTADTTITISTSPGAQTLASEYIFVNVGIEVTSAGSGTTQDMDFRVGSAYKLATPNFTQSVVAGSGSIALTGTNVTLKVGHLLSLGTGSLSLSGASATLLQSHDIAVNAGSLTIAGSAATLTYTTAVGYTLSASLGTIAISGQAVTLNTARKISSTAGSLGISGSAAVLKSGHILGSDVGSFAVSGKTATLLRGYKVSGASASITLSGTAASIKISRALQAAGSGLSLSGLSVGLKRTYRLALGQSSFALTGSIASLSYTPVGSFQITANGGNIAFAGNPSGLLISRHLIAGNGQFSLTGTVTGFVHSRAIQADSGNIGLSGKDISLVYIPLTGAYRLYAISASLNISGGSATLDVVGEWFVETWDAAVNSVQLDMASCSVSANDAAVWQVVTRNAHG